MRVWSRNTLRVPNTTNKFTEYNIHFWSKLKERGFSFVLDLKFYACWVATVQVFCHPTGVAAVLSVSLPPFSSFNIHQLILHTQQFIQSDSSELYRQFRFISAKALKEKWLNNHIIKKKRETVLFALVHWRPLTENDGWEYSSSSFLLKRPPPAHSQIINNSFGRWWTHSTKRPLYTCTKQSLLTAKVGFSTQPLTKVNK